MHTVHCFTGHFFRFIYLSVSFPLTTDIEAVIGG